MFMKHVQKKGMSGGISQRALRSRFASDLPISLINEISERRKNKTGRRYSNLPVFQVKNSLNDGVSSSSSSNLSLFQGKNSVNDGASTNNPSYGGRKGMMASSSSSGFLTRDFKLGDTIVGNDSFNHFNYGVKNWNFGSTSKSNTLPKNVNLSSINNNSFRSIEVGTGTTNKGRFDNVSPNSFGFNFMVRKENMNFRPCLHEKFGLVHGGFGLIYGGVSRSDFDTRLANGVNVVETRGIHLHKLKAIVENEEQNNQMEFKISDFMVADQMNIHNEVCKH